MTDFGDALNKAIEAGKDKKVNINTLVWKYKNGTTKRLMDMDQEELQKCYDHCESMLWSHAKVNPGKYVIKKILNRTYENVNAELFMRYVLHELNIETLKTNKDLFDFINANKVSQGLKDSDYVTKIFSGVPTIFEKVTIDRLLSACFDKLDALNRKIISDKFIISQGIWLTKEEFEDLTEYDDKGKMRDKMDVIRERLVLNTNLKLRIDRKGLSYQEFRSLVMLDQYPKISNLPTATLKLLRDKILLLLDYDLNYHIEKWEDLEENIRKVAEKKKFVLVSKDVA